MQFSEESVSRRHARIDPLVKDGITPAWQVVDLGSTNGTLVNGNFWSTISSSTFYAAAPANYYAQFWHTHGIAGKAYGFPYDDVGGYSSDISCNSPQYLQVAVGW